MLSQAELETDGSRLATIFGLTPPLDPTRQTSYLEKNRKMWEKGEQ